MRTLLFLLLSTLIVAQTNPRMRFFKYTGTGVDSEREVYTEIDQEISAVFVAVPLTSPTYLDHPHFLYVRVKECDDFVGNDPLGTGANADSICFFGTAGGLSDDITITPKGIKRWYGDTVVVGKYCNLLDTTYYMWVVSDPDSQFFVSGIYIGDGTTPRTITVSGITDSLYGLFVMPPRQQSSYRHYATWSIGSGNSQYFGERGADMSTFTDNDFDVLENIVAKMNTNTQWYSWFAVTKDAEYVQTYKYTGNSAATSADTLLFDRSGFLPFLIFGNAYIGGSATTGAMGSGALGGNRDTSWAFNSVTNVDVEVSTNAAAKKIVPDSLILTSGGRWDLNGTEIKLFMFGDTAFYTPLATSPESSLRQPCEGNTTILQKENIKWQDKYK